MALVLSHNEAGLRKPTVQVGATSTLLALAGEMFAALPGWGGSGLAAPQVGYGIRLAVVEFETLRLPLVNPTFSTIGKPRQRLEDVEGCLSLPGRHFRVKRFPAIVVNTHLPGGMQSLTAHGWLARIIQHELDHLEGVLIDTVGAEIAVVPALAALDESEAEPEAEP